MTITSLTNEKIKDLMKLDQKKHRQETGRFMVEGRHMVDEAIGAGLCREVFTTDLEYSGFGIVTVVSDDVMTKLSRVQTPQGILAVCKKPEATVLSNKILMLDGIHDPGNLGTLLRSALAFGFTTVLVDDCVDFTNPKVLRSTQGSIFHLQILETRLAEFIADHREYHYFGTDVHGGKPLDRLEVVPHRCGLILGNEASGVRKELLALTDENLFIELAGIESLNVAVAGGILMHRFH